MKTGIITIGGDEQMNKDYLNPFDHEYEDPEEKEQADREDKIFKQLMTCSTIVSVIIGLIIVLIFIFVFLNR